MFQGSVNIDMNLNISNLEPWNFGTLEPWNL
jgi:hypothetical protein